MITIDDVFRNQDASDMFFNHEAVCKAYAASIDMGSLEEDRPSFIDGLIEFGFTPQEADIIAADYLARV